MYVRAKTFKNKNGSQRTYLQIVQTERAGKSVRQRVIANLGRLDEMQTGPIDNLIASFGLTPEFWTTTPGLVSPSRDFFHALRGTPPEPCSGCLSVACVCCRTP